MAVTPGGLLSAANPASTQFTVENLGYLDACDIEPFWGLSDLRVDLGNSSKLELSELSVAGIFQIIDTLRGGEQANWDFSRLLNVGQSPGTADIVLMVGYRIKIAPFLGRFEYTQGFVSVTNYAGQIQWTPRATNIRFTNDLPDLRKAIPHASSGDR